ncbi:membrane-spanning 4-domains subfamily A member 6A-like [Dugong dugon]
MISQHTPNETIVILTPNDFKFPQTEKPKPTTPRQDSMVKRLMTEIKVLGSIQIMCGLMVLSLGLILMSSSFSPQFTPVYSTLLKSAYPFIGAFCFVISGSLGIITEKKSIKTLVQTSLATNILSCVSAVVGFILLSIGLAALGHASQQCDLDKEVMPTSKYNYHHRNPRACFMATINVTGVMSMMLIFTVLEFCLAVIATVLWWKQAHSDFLGSVLFLPRSDNSKSKILSKMTFDPIYEELLTS